MLKKHGLLQRYNFFFVHDWKQVCQLIEENSMPTRFESLLINLLVYKHPYSCQQNLACKTSVNFHRCSNKRNHFSFASEFVTSLTNPISVRRKLLRLTTFTVEFASFQAQYPYTYIKGYRLMFLRISICVDENGFQNNHCISEYLQFF